MRDGAVLLADRWSPKGGGDGLPIALIRTPYGRAGTLALGAAKPLVERGFQAVIVNARATFGSDGPFNPFLCEREDGLDVLDWVAKQPWAGESIVLVGASYVGYTQWSVADAVPPQVKAMVPVVSNATFTMAFNREGGFALETPFTWAVQVERQERRFANVRNALEEREILRARGTLPLSQADVGLLGHRNSYFQNVLDHDGDGPFWQAADHVDKVADITVPASLVGGWYDLFLPNQLRDFQTLRRTGPATPHRVTIGPWAHWATAMDGLATREALEWGLALARGEAYRSAPRCACSSWARTSGATAPPGRPRDTSRSASTSSPEVPWPAIYLSSPLRTSTTTTRPTRPPRSAAYGCGPCRSTAVWTTPSWRRAPTSSPTQLPLWTRTSRSSAR
jgi:putative CocE/NonD family hydrolase